MRRPAWLLARLLQLEALLPRAGIADPTGFANSRAQRRLATGSAPGLPTIAHRKSDVLGQQPLEPTDHPSKVGVAAAILGIEIGSVEKHCWGHGREE